MIAGLSVLYEDERVIAVDKPSGLAVHGLARTTGDDLVSRLRGERLDLAPVHRLDRATSGVLLLAKGPAAARELGQAFQGGLVQKIYVAAVRGEVEPAEVLVDHPIPRDDGAERVAAQTWVRGLATVTIAASPLRERRYSLALARPLTGRFHQVRRHLKHLSHPILCDANYGKSEHDRFVRQGFGLSRLALHARRLVLEGWLDVTAPMPDDLAEPLTRLGLLAGSEPTLW